MTNKVKVSREIGDSLQYYESYYGFGWKSAMISQVVMIQVDETVLDGDYTDENILHAKNLSSIHIEELAKIIVNDYEVMLSEMDEVRKLFNTYSGDCEYDTDIKKDHTKNTGSTRKKYS